MNRGPAPGSREPIDFVSRATTCWGNPPDWVIALAEEAGRTSLTKTARRLGYSASTVSQVVSASYRGDLERVEGMVRGALMATTVDCPVLGEIGKDRCLDEQGRPFAATSAHRAQLYHWCRGRCPHSKSYEGDGNAE